tara:strand:+ start:121 stop:366 length:246 start_codon:yes stop_codon:yes gene_type:complete
MSQKENNLVLTVEQSVEMCTRLTHILVDFYGLEGALETEVDEHGNESYTERSQERFDAFNGEADQIMFALGFTTAEQEVQS